MKRAIQRRARVDSAGVTEDGMPGENRPRTWEVLYSPDTQVGTANRKEGVPTGYRNSYRPIVLRGRESRPHGEGVDGKS